MKPLRHLEGPLAALPRENVDTDAIIPADRTREITTRLGPGLFGNWRYDRTGKEVADFVLNKPSWRDAVALVAGANFGCGSSREHAVWALADFGIRAIFAPSFGDIFKANCARNGLLAAELDKTVIARLLNMAQEPTQCRIVLDLEDGKLSTITEDIPLEISPSLRDALMSGRDEIADVLDRSADIDAFQQRERLIRPWVYFEQ
ncbi:MAG: 3-isopropylmalate dehydratase small subunit [Pseudomonadota bacterium]